MADKIEIVVTGDFVPGGQINSGINPLKDLYQIDSDYYWLNLECGFPYNYNAIKNNSSKVPGDRRLLFKWLHDFNNNILFSSANNHAGDYGEKSILKTIDSFNQEGFHIFGIGKNNNSFIINKYGIKIGLIALTSDQKNVGDHLQGTLRNNISVYSNATINEVKTIKKEVDFLIVSFHFGKEFIPYPIPEDRLIAKKMIDNGADMIFGHHAHLVQGYEIYKGKSIYYGLGNFFFPNYLEPQPLKWTKMQKSGLLLKLTVADCISVKIIPTYHNNKDKIIFLKDIKLKKAIDHVELISKPLKLSDQKYEQFFNKELNKMLRNKILTGVFKKKFLINKRNINKFLKLFKQLLKGKKYFRNEK